MQIPVLSGIYTNQKSDFRVSYPRNLMPVPVTSAGGQGTGISNGYLRPAYGIDSVSTGPGVDRGGINWNGSHYRVMGSKLVSVDASGNITTIGDVGSGSHVSMDYSFDRLAIASNNNLFYYNGTTLSQVTDPDLGQVHDMIWVDGYFMTTDGEFLVVTELTNPDQVDPFKYGSSEADPDPVLALIKLDNEPYALNRYTIEVFNNIGGTSFPFQRVDGAQIPRGTVGTHTCCHFEDAIAFVGGGRNETISVYIARGGSSARISTREIDQILAEYSEETLSGIYVESQIDQGHRFLHIHLPDQTLVYDAAATRVVGAPVWFILSSTLEGVGRYRGQHMVYVDNKWWIGDTNSSNLGSLTNDHGEHWGETVGWEFSTAIIYNNGTGAIFHELELVSLTGRAAFGDDPTIWTEYSTDGVTWSMPKSRTAGTFGQRNKRLNWLGQGRMRHWRIQRFYGTSDARMSVARLEARLEPLAV